ncbi:MAG: hypothetical protein MJK18_02745, partial [Bdellovibrionales bacterium]|nr:hypothetical protein [Bdellovibrionales bacterium]
IVLHKPKDAPGPSLVCRNSGWLYRQKQNGRLRLRRPGLLRPTDLNDLPISLKLDQRFKPLW